MDKAKQAVSDFVAKAGHHDTTVHERVAPGVTNETVAPMQKEERQIATDREVHQDHYHTSVQPVKHREVLPEQHHHNLVPVEHRTHDHRDTQDTESRLHQNATQFKNQSMRTETQHNATAAPTVTGEHVHHHVHETIQPVVHKETIEPHVMHTTVPVHEVHHNKAQHHAASALPAVSMNEFKHGGGSLTGRDERVDHFDGEPKSLEHSLGGHKGAGHHSNTREGGMIGNHGSGDRTGPASGATSGLPGTSATQGSSSGMTGNNPGAPILGSNNTGGMGHSSHTDQTHKPSLMDKLNPMKDADGDGKKGFMK